MKKIWKEQRLVNWEDTAMNGRLSLKALNLFLVRSAINHAEHLGFGYTELIKENISWVLFRLNIKIERMPVLNEEIVVVTWPGKLFGISASREFQIFSKQSDELLCSATSDWLIIDLETRKPQRMDRFEGAEYLNTGKKALNQKPPKFNGRCEFEELFSVKTYYSDLDMNGHVIASKYFTWLEDAVFQMHGDKKIDFLQMSYFNECHLDEDISIRFCPEDKLSFMGHKLKSDKTAFTAVVSFQ